MRQAHCILGTFWYHSHESVQYCDGLRGPLVIYDPDDPHKDLYDVDDGTLAPWALSVADPCSTTCNRYYRYLAFRLVSLTRARAPTWPDVSLYRLSQYD